MSIHYVKSKGAYCFSFKRNVNGKQVRATKLLPKAWSQKQAHEFDLKETARLYALHTGVTHSRPTIEQAVLLYLEHKAPELKTFEYIQEDFARLLPFFEGKFLDELPDVAAAINKQELSAGSRRRRIAQLCSACNYAFKYHNLGAANPSERVQLPKVRDARQMHPSRKEMLTIARLARRKELRAAILTAFYSGMRRSEILKAVVDGEVFKLYDTKNGAVRFIPIHRKLFVYRKEFPMSMTIDELSGAWIRVRNRAGLKHYRFHDLRHSTASELINGGADLYTVGRILGHKSAVSTSRYAHLLTDSLNAALQRIGSVIKRQT